MHIVSRGLWLPKFGNSAAEYEDAVAPMDAKDCLVTQFRCAIADGATETSFAGDWARLLVSGFVERINRELLKEYWRAAVAERELSWFAREKAQGGAFAAFLGLCLQQDDTGNSGTWLAEACGDCCLLQIRGDQILEAFPLRHSCQFNDTPILLGSCSLADDPQEILVEKSGCWQEGDLFYLLSDALARWMYIRQEEYADAAKFLPALSAAESLEKFAQEQRELLDGQGRPLLRNDDVTLLSVEICAHSKNT